MRRISNLVLTSPARVKRSPENSADQRIRRNDCAHKRRQTLEVSDQQRTR